MPLAKWLVASYVRTAIIPLLLIEIGFLAIYWVSGNFTYDRNVQTVQTVSKDYLNDIANREVMTISATLDGIEGLARLYASETGEALATPYDPGAAEKARYRLSPDGMFFTRYGRNQTASFYSGIEPVGPAQIDTVEEGLFRDAVAYARQTNRPFTTHIAQAVVEVREIIRRHGITPIQWAGQLGLLGPTSILGHAIFVDEHPSVGWHTTTDLALIAESGTAVAHCPSPFARYGEHLAHFGKYQARGVRMGLGTDVAPHNLIEEMRLAILLARGMAKHIDAASTASLFHAGTVGGADALGRPDLGRLAPGMAADVVLVDLAHPLMQPARDPLRNLVWHAADRAIRRVYVAGELALADGKPVGLDTTEAGGILAESQARMLRDSAKRDYLKRDGDVLAPLSLHLPH